MWKRKLCLGTSRSFDIPTEEQIKIFSEIGFEGFFTNYSDNTTECRKIADSLGMLYQSIHAPFSQSAQMWKPDATDAVNELIHCCEICSKVEVPLLICHVWIGFNYSDKPNEYGLNNWDKVITRAKELGVKIALENTEGEEFLEYLMNSFADRDNVGFCFDSGHEMCYNRSRDLLSIYGDRLLGTHINDNLGVRDYNGNITYIDDLHLLPFDGIADWNDIALRLNKCNFEGPLTFELLKKNYCQRHDLKKYEKLPLEEYVAECYARACKFSILCEKFSIDKFHN